MASKPKAEAEYSRAATLFDEMNRLYKRWGAFQPKPPLRRGDVALLGILTAQEDKGDDGIALGRLAKLARQTPPAITQKVNGLEKLGYLERVPDEEDRRVTYVQLTEKGRSATKNVWRTMMENVERSFDALGAKQSDELIRLLHKLGDAMEQAAQQSAKPENEVDTL